MEIPLRLLIAIIVATAGMALTYALLPYNIFVQQGEFDLSSYWVLVMPGGVLGLLYALFVLTPVYLFICWFLQHGILAFLKVSIAIWVLLSFLIPNEINNVQFGSLMIFLPLGIVGAIVFALAMGNEHNE